MPVNKIFSIGIFYGKYVIVLCAIMKSLFLPLTQIWLVVGSWWVSFEQHFFWEGKKMNKRMNDSIQIEFHILFKSDTWNHVFVELIFRSIKNLLVSFPTNLCQIVSSYYEFSIYSYRLPFKFTSKHLQSWFLLFIKVTFFLCSRRYIINF